MAKRKDVEHVLGLDLGVNSVGWALIRYDDGEPAGLVDAGVRIFQAGVDLNDYQQGKPASLAADRRAARQQRRMTERRARRLRKVFHLLQHAALLPAGEPAAVLPELDKRILREWRNSPTLTSDMRNRLDHVLPYWLRARALDEPLSKHELGRALYHLAQRRGFKSNRKSPERSDEDQGEVKSAISELGKQMAEANCRTIAEYLSTLDPHEERIRARWTGRKMYEDEFESIWAAQQSHHAEVLTPDFKKRLHTALFYQRPLKSAHHLIGECELEPGRKRLAWAYMDAQRNRILQQVVHSKLMNEHGSLEDLTPEQRQTLIAELDTRETLSYAKARKALGVSSKCKFSQELSGGEKRFVGNRTAARLRPLFDGRWEQLTDEDHDRLVEDLLSIEDPVALARRGRTRWAFDEETARKFAETRLESDYGRLSRRAIKKINPLMRKGLAYAAAVKEAYGVFHRHTEPVDQLPPVAESLTDIRNPAVQRTLTELRHVVNAIIRKHGKPDAVRVELARDMRRNARQRSEVAKRNRAREKEREDAAEAILGEAGIAEPSRTDIEKYLLAVECDWHCPYTGNPISMASLFGPEPQFDIEHIIPFSRSLDNSFLNKTLCDIAANRNEKRNQTPWEAYGADETRWDEIMQRVRAFKGSAAGLKLHRFGLKEIESIEAFASKQLQDTRYASKLARKYLALLYGGLSDEGGTSRVQAARGGVTAFLRNVWEMNGILGDGDRKSRDDHRHHAVDAIAVALTEPGVIKALSDAAERAARRPRRLFEDMEPPWPGFLDDVRNTVAGIVVSHRVSRRLSGALHEETIYSPPRTDPDGRECHHVRKPLRALGTNEVQHIVDDRVRALVEEKLSEEGGTPAQVFKSPGKLPCFVAKDGRHIPIRKVRLRRYTSAFPLSSGSRSRHVLSKSNHHMEIIEHQRAGRKRWEGKLVSLYEATKRYRLGTQVIRKDHGVNGRFVFSIAGGDILELNGAQGQGVLVLVRTLSEGRVEFHDIRDARVKKEIKANGRWVTRSAEKLRQLGCRKVCVSPLGEVRKAND